MPSDEPLEALRARAQPIALDLAERQAFAATMNALAATRLMGGHFELDDAAVVRLRLEAVAAHHQGGLGTRAVNGAVIAAMFDAALGVAGTLQFPGQRAGTVELSIKLLRPAFEAPLEVFAVAIKRTPHLAFTEAELQAAGKLCAIATGIVAVVSNPKDGDSYW